MSTAITAAQTGMLSLIFTNARAFRADTPWSGSSAGRGALPPRVPHLITQCSQSLAGRNGQVT
jgi:hypothetical protein